MGFIGKLRERKILGVPAIYYVAALVVGLAIYAWRLKPAASSEVVDVVDESLTVDPVTGESFPAMPVGTVSVAPSVAGSVPSTDNASILDNPEWLRKGVAELTRRDVSPVEAQRALQLYLSGADMSYVQGRWAETIIRELGLPPEPPYTVGKTGAKPVPPSTSSNTPKPAPANAELSGKAAPTAPAGRRYVVVRGDTLSGIGARFGVPWQTIYSRNRSVIGSNPNRIYPGQVITIP